MDEQQKERDPVYRRSEQIVPFCPTCKKELDRVDMINCFDSCECGEWWDAKIGTIMFKPYPLKKPYTVTVNGEDQP
jgi:hypothetical protein